LFGDDLAMVIIVCCSSVDLGCCVFLRLSIIYQCFVVASRNQQFIDWRL